MQPKPPVEFDVEENCPPLPQRYTIETVAEHLGTCAFEAIKNGDENRDIAQYNKRAADHNAPDGIGDRLKIFSQGLGFGGMAGALLGAYVTTKAVLLFTPYFWVVPFLP